MKKKIGIRFKPAGKVYDFDSGAFVLNSGDHVIVETEQGLGFGTVAVPPKPYGEPAEGRSEKLLKKVFRLANQEDFLQREKNLETEKRAHAFCLKCIKELELKMIKQWETNLPPGYWWEAGGELFESKQAKGELSLSLGISLLMIILLLVIQYNGFAKPVIILTTLPLALIGSYLGLYVTGNALGFMPQLGLLALFGIVVNTAIIFIEFADILIKEKIEECDGSGPIMGMSVQEFRECLVQAGQVRLLPIAMTTLTTIGGLLPLALAGGPLWEGMAWLMIFGLMVATILTLIVVPSLYAIFVENFKIKPVRIAAQVTLPDSGNE